MERAPGYTLREFFERKYRNTIEVSEAIQLVQNLAGIIKRIHTKNVFHQNISPDNIMIEWDSKPESIGFAHLTLLGFSHAFIVSNEISMENISARQSWYSAPQASVKAMSSTVDASGICAIFFWLLTKMNPQHENGELPHEKFRDKLNDVIDNAINSIRMYSKLLFENKISIEIDRKNSFMN